MGEINSVPPFHEYGNLIVIPCEADKCSQNAKYAIQKVMIQVVFLTYKKNIRLSFMC